MYPSAMVLPYGAAVRWLPDPFHTFIGVFLIAFLLLAVCFYAVLRRTFRPAAAMLLVASTAVNCYPFLLLIQRENMEVVSWTLITIGLWSFYRERFTWAAVCIGLATALKLYPLVFFGLFLPRRLYRDLAIGIASCAAVTLLGLRVMSPDIGFAYAWDKTQLGAFGRYYTTSMLGLGYDHSFFALVKCATLPWMPDLDRVLSFYTWTVVIGCIVLFFGRLNHELESWGL
jgi:Glycosyltransferase family 87